MTAYVVRISDWSSDVCSSDLAEGKAALEGQETAKAPPKTFKQAVTQIVLADVSMSLDNVLAVAGAAREHTWVLVIGLALSVALMGFAASFIARLLNRYHWIAYVGLRSEERRLGKECVRKCISRLRPDH